MGNSTETTIPATTRRDTLKSAIKTTLREMMVDAAEGRVQLPDGIPNTADILDQYKVRLAFVDFLLNPPWIKATGTIPSPHEMKDLDADVDDVVDKVDDHLAEKRPRRRKLGKRK